MHPETAPVVRVGVVGAGFVAHLHGEESIELLLKYSRPARIENNIAMNIART